MERRDQGRWLVVLLPKGWAVQRDEYLVYVAGGGGLEARDESVCGQFDVHSCRERSAGGRLLVLQDLRAGAQHLLRVLDQVLQEELEEKMLLIEVLHLPTFIETILSHSLTRQ